MGAAFRDFIETLDRAGCTGSNGSYTCPAHDDGTPSLSVTDGDGSVLVHCHAGCATEEVVAALGLTMGDLFDRSNGHRQPVATWTYTDEAGEPLYRLNKFEPGFNGQASSKRPERADGRYGKHCMDGVRRVLYRLPETLAAVAAGEEVWLPEGESDADAIVAAGRCATTNIFGAKSWKTVPDRHEVLRGARVAVVLDNDDAGTRRGLTILADLEGVAASIRVLRPVTGKDVRDHLEAGLGLDDLAPVDLVPVVEPSMVETGQRPPLDVTYPAEMADWLRETLGTGRLAGMFARGPDIVHTPREGEDGYIPLSDDENDHDGPAQVRSADADVIAARCQYTFNCYQVTKKGAEPALFPTSAARVACNAVDMLPSLRRLRGVVHSPIVRADGTVLSAPGYDPATQLLHIPEAGLEVPPVPEMPMGHAIKTAVDLLDKMTAGFRWVTPHDQANYYGLLLTPLLRELVPPPYKLGAISAPQPGSGKTLLATGLRIVHGGVFRSEVPEDEAEMRKQITSILSVTTGAVVVFDNVTGVLRSSTLSGLLTSARWDDRLLGVNKMVSRTNDRLWVITGNNVTLGGDLVRRTLWVTIDPGVPDPHLRTGFAIANLEGWVAEHRAELLWSLLVLVRAWVVAGRPTEARGSDGFARWVETVAGILGNAGVPGTFADVESARQTIGADDSDWGEFLEAARRAFGDQPWSVKELLGKVNAAGSSEHHWAKDRPIPLDALPAELADRVSRAHNATIVAKSLGRWLSNREGRWAGGLAVRRAGTRRADEKLWTVQEG